MPPKAKAKAAAQAKAGAKGKGRARVQPGPRPGSKQSKAASRVVNAARDSFSYRLFPSPSPVRAFSYTTRWEVDVTAKAGNQTLVLVSPFGSVVGLVVTGNGVGVTPSYVINDKLSQVFGWAQSPSATATDQVTYRHVLACVEVVNTTALSTVGGVVYAARITGDTTDPTTLDGFTQLTATVKVAQTTSMVSAGEMTHSMCLKAARCGLSATSFARTNKVGLTSTANWLAAVFNSESTTGGTAYGWSPAAIVLDASGISTDQAYKFIFVNTTEIAPCLGSASEPLASMTPVGSLDKSLAVDAAIQKAPVFQPTGGMARQTRGILG